MARQKRVRLPKITTVIGRETEIMGSVRFDGGLHLDGTVKGDVEGKPGKDSTLTVGRTGTIEGDVRVTNVILDGTVMGDVRAADRAELARNARVTGKLHYQWLDMAMGAQVNGQLIHGKGQEAPLLRYDGDHDAQQEPPSIRPADALTGGAGQLEAAALRDVEVIPAGDDAGNKLD